MLVWNGVIRFLMETYIEVLLAAAINLRYGQMHAEKRSTRYSMVMSFIAFSVLTLGTPVALLLWWRKRSVWGDVNFKAKYGSLLKGIALKENAQKSTIAVPCMFFTRRLLLVSTIVLFGDFAWGQLMLMVAISIVNISFLTRAFPMKSKRSNCIEVFNEITMLLLHYTLLLMTHFVPSPI